MDSKATLCVVGKAWLALAVSCVLLSSSQAQETDLPKKVLALNNVTGALTMVLKKNELVANPKETKLFLAEGLKLVKEADPKKDPVFNYNAALILATAAKELQDLPRCEIYYRMATKEAARLQSANHLLESYGGLIEAYYDAKKYADASRVCKELLDLNTDDGKERVIINTAGHEQDSFDPAARLRPGVTKLYIQSLAKQGKYGLALKLADEQIKQNDHWLNRQLKAMVLQEAGKFEEAAKTYEDVIEGVEKEENLSPKEREIYAERYRYALSGIYLDMNKVDRCTEILQKLLEMRPNSSIYNNDLGYIWADHDMKLEQAEKLVRKALEIERKLRKSLPDLSPEDDRDNGAYLDSLGWVLFKQKRYKEAKEVLLKAVEDKSTQHLEIYDHLGDTLFALGERSAAITAWRKGLELASDNRRDRERKALVEKKLEKNK